MLYINQISCLQISGQEAGRSGSNHVMLLVFVRLLSKSSVDIPKMAQNLNIQGDPKLNSYLDFPVCNKGKFLFNT